jgi:succinoglycan biosynthesis transport protein ExoP
MMLTTILCIAVSLIACFTVKKRYQAFGVIQLQKSNSSGLNLEGLAGEGGGRAGDSLSANVDLQTQVATLQSNALALATIKKLNLEQNPDFVTKPSLLGKVRNFLSFSSSTPAESQNTPLEMAPIRREGLLHTFSENLNVKVVAGTRLIRVEYSNPNPEVSAAVVNTLVQSLVEYTFQTKYNSTKEVSTWLEGQLSDLRKHSEDMQTKLVAERKNTDLFGVAGMDSSGKSAVYSPIIDRLTQSTAALAQTEQNRVLKGAVAQVAATGNAELISQLTGTSVAAAGGQGVASSLTLIQTLRGQESTLLSQIALDASKFGSAYPKLIEERASLARTQQSLQDEVVRIKDRAENDYAVALKAEEAAKSVYASNREAAENLNDKTIDYSILEREVNQSQNLYQDLLRRLEEAGITEGLHSTDITVVDRSLPPARPSTPQKSLYLMFGIVLGVLLSFVVGFIVDSIDSRIQTLDEVDALGMSTLGILPRYAHQPLDQDILIARADPKSIFSESIRRLRSSLLMARSGNPPKIILIASSIPGEGKSTVSLNLAFSTAQAGKKVLLLEADFRRPVLQRRLGLPLGPGLSGLLTDSAIVVAPARLEGATLDVLAAGPIPPYPSELLGSLRMKELLDVWSGEYDFIVIDSPPTLPVTDSQLLEVLADATIIVARSRVTTRAALQRTYTSLLPYTKDLALPAIGVVLNDVETTSMAYYNYYGSYGDKSSYYADNQEGKK